MNSKLKNIINDLFTLHSKKESKFLSLELGKHKEKEIVKQIEAKQKELVKKENTKPVPVPTELPITTPVEPATDMAEDALDHEPPLLVSEALHFVSYKPQQDRLLVLVMD